MKIKKILVSQPKPSSEKSPYYDLEKKYGFVCDFRPFIKVEGLNVRDFLAQRIDVLSHTAVIFTARTAIDHFFRLAEELLITIPEDMKILGLKQALHDIEKDYPDSRDGFKANIRQILNKLGVKE